MSQGLSHVELNSMVMRRDSNNFFSLEYDQKAIDVFLEEVKAKTIMFPSVRERYEWLLENEYYDNDVVSRYSMEFIERLHKIAYSYGFRPKSYTSATKLYNEYILRTWDKKNFLEDYEQHCVIVALELGRGSKKRAERQLRAYMEQRVQPATPTFLNAGRKKRGEYVSCFLLTIDDTTESIEYNIGVIAQLSRIGGGIAFDVSNIRAKGDPVNGRDGSARGIIGTLKRAELTLAEYDQGGLRKGSGAGYYNIFGYDVVDFLDTKKINADERIRLKTLSLGLIVPQKFYDLVEENKQFVGFSPYDIRKYYGLKMSEVDFDKWYDTFLQDKRIRKRQLGSARNFMTRIAKMQIQSGYPYIFNVTNANKRHALNRVGRILITNLCTEIMQLQEISEINDYFTDDIIRRDVSCNLASLNIENVMSRKAIAESVYDAMDATTSVSMLSDIRTAPGVRLANSELHSVGIGAMGLHGYLADKHIPYDSFEAKDFVRTFFMMMNFYSLKASMEYARTLGETFKDFDKSTYADGTYFKRYEINDYSPHSEKVKGLFEGMHVPTIEDWKQLKEDVMRYGLYHAYRLAIAPTQGISYTHHVTSSIAPIMEQVETRTYGNSTTYYPVPNLRMDTHFLLRSAFSMDMMDIIDLYALAQEHVDQGISMVLYVSSKIPTSRLVKMIMHANKRGIKSIYYVRTRKSDIEECEACQV